MVAKNGLFIRRARPLSKETRINFIKNELLAPATAQFNFDCLYAEDLNLKDTQEKFSYLPVRAAKRLLVIKNALRLNDDIKEFLLSFFKSLPAFRAYSGYRAPGFKGPFLGPGIQAGKGLALQRRGAPGCLYLKPLNRHE